MFVIEEVKDENQKKAVVAEVLKDLPEWFGIPESTQAYIEGTTTLQVWTAYQESDLTGFVSLSYSSEDCAEIDCLGVKKLIKVEKLGANCLLLQRVKLVKKLLICRSKQWQKVLIKIMIEQMTFIEVLALKSQRFFFNYGIRKILVRF